MFHLYKDPFKPNPNPNPQNLRLIISLMQNNPKAEYIVNGNSSPGSVRKRGLLQGSCLSPLLFSLFIDSLSERLNQGNSISALLFADDIVLFPENGEQSEILLQTLSHWCDENGMKVNAAKCGVTGLKDQRLNDEYLPTITGYKYLGLPLTRNGIDWETHVQKTALKMQSCLSLLYRLGVTLSYRQKILLYRTFIRPVGEYGLGLFGVDRGSNSPLLKPLEQVQQKALRWIFRAKGATRTMESIAGLESTKCRVKTLTCYLNRHLCSLDKENPVVLLRAERNGSNNNDLITKSKSEPKWVSQFRAAQLFLGFKGNFKAFVKQKKIKHVEDLNGKRKLLAYVSSAARMKPGGMLKCLGERTSESQRFTVLWRLGSFGIRNRCTTCLKNFTRGHIASCISAVYGKEYWAAQEESQAKLQPIKSSFNYADFLCNTGKGKEAMEIVKRLIS